MQQVGEEGLWIGDIGAFTWSKKGWVGESEEQDENVDASAGVPMSSGCSTSTPTLRSRVGVLGMKTRSSGIATSDAELLRGIDDDTVADEHAEAEELCVVSKPCDA